MSGPEALAGPLARRVRSDTVRKPQVDGYASGNLVFRGVLNPNLVNRKYGKRMRHQGPQPLLPEPSPNRFGLEYHSGFHAAARVEVLIARDTDRLLTGLFDNRQKQAYERTAVP